jgi:acetate kinase
MTDAIIVLNAGSSSLKFSLYGVNEAELALHARGQIEGVGAAPHFTAKDHDGHTLADLSSSSSPELRGSSHWGHAEAFEFLARWARDHFTGALNPVAVGHRVVHGGAAFTAPTLLNSEVVSRLTQLAPLAPLHQPHNLACIHAVTRLRPDLPQVACFDTAFHRGRAPVTEHFALPESLFDAGVRRWGFHGLSYDSIARRLPTVAPEIARGRVIVAHLGNGASLCALRDGKSVDTTMSFSVLDGLPMGTRCGALDPGVLLYLLRNGMDVHGLEKLLYHKSGLLGISGVSSDVRDLLASDRPSAAQAIDFLVYRVVREAGSLAAALGGLDGFIFTAGIGENSPVIRKRVCDGLKWLGLDVDDTANAQGRGRISPEGKSPSAWVIPTDEESVIAAGTQAVACPPASRLTGLVALIVSVALSLGLAFGAHAAATATQPAAATAEHSLSQSAGEITRVFGFPITNSMLVSWIAALGLIGFAQFATRNMQQIPKGAQNFWEALVEMLYNFIEGIIGSHLAKRTFWFFATTFIFILCANWIGLVPGVGTIGWGHRTDHGFVIDQPLFRGANADLNMTMAIALVFFGAWIVWSLWELGPVGCLKELFAPKGETTGLLRVLLVVVFFIVGCLEIVSILFRPVSLSFRLYGNTFAGENMLETMSRLVPGLGWLLPIPFYFLELLVGLVQALVFMLLTAVFTLLMCQHEEPATAPSTQT